MDQDMGARGFGPEGYPGERPRWTEVPTSKFGVAPYNRVCQVVALSGGVRVAAGSGWLHARNLVLTAAHVVDGADAVELRFPGRDWLAAAVRKIATGYHAPNGAPRKCSGADLATVTPLAELAIDIAAFSPVSGVLPVAVGFADGTLVEHAGTALDVGPFAAHNCDTDHEHSGCPLLTGSGLRGIHVGQFSGSRPYLSPPQSQTTGYLNSAVRLTPSAAALLDL